MAEPSPTPWHVTARLAALRGEERANALRVLGVTVFYAIEVLNYRGLAIGPIQIPSVAGVDATFHAASTALAVAWMAVAAAVLVAVKNRIFPPVLQYVSTGADLMLLTGVLMLADGPKSPMVLVLFLVVVLAGLRLSPALVAYATGGAVMSYLFVLGEVAQRRPDLRVPPHWQITTVAALVLCGVVVWSILAQVRRAVEAYAALQRRQEEP